MFETLKGYLENPENLLPLDEGVSCFSLSQPLSCVLGLVWLIEDTVLIEERQCNVTFDLNDSKASTANGMSESERERELESLGGSL